MKLYKSLVLSVLLYGCETWTLNAELEKRIQAFENKSHRKILRISYTERKTNEWVKQQITALAGGQQPLLATVKRRKLAWYGHVSCHDSLSKTILQGTVEGKRKRGRQRKSWIDNIKEWTDCPADHLIRMAEDRERWRSLVVESSLAPLRPQSRDQ